MKATVNLTPANVASVADLQIHVDVVNGGSAPAQVNTLFFPIPSVSLDVRDAAGRSVPKGPPPVPPIDDGRGLQTLPPGGSVGFDYTGGGLFPSGLGAGTYEIRFHGYSNGTTPSEITSDWVKFTVR